jgi:hypothetical protein
MPDNQGHRGRLKLPPKLDDLADHRAPGHRVDELGEAGAHPRALPGGQDYQADAT